MRAWPFIGIFLGACGFQGAPIGDGAPGIPDAASDAPAGTPDARRFDAPPGTPDADPPDADPPDADPVGCPAGYAVVALAPVTSRYRFVATTTMWLAAEQDCEDDGVGTHLAVLDDLAEKNAIDAANGNDIWVGLSDRVTEGVWLAVTGQAMIYTVGLGGGDNGKNCARIKNSSGAVEHRDCASAQAFVCECDGVAANPLLY